MSTAPANVETVAEGLWTLRYPLCLLAVPIGRTVTVIRLESGELIIHSTAPFTKTDLAAIHALGRPSWLVDATLVHDTFVKEARAAFPGVPFLTPEGFPEKSGATKTITPPPAEWATDVEVIPLDGMPRIREHAFLHRPTRTLVVADLVFNIAPSAGAWTRMLFRLAGIRQFPGVSRWFRSMIRDRAAFSRSIDRMMSRDFDRLIVGHGDAVESGAREKLAAALEVAGLLTRVPDC